MSPVARYHGLGVDLDEVALVEALGDDAGGGAGVVGEHLDRRGLHERGHVAGVLGELEVGVERRLVARVHAHRGLEAGVELVVVALPELGQRVALGLDPVLGALGLGRGDGGQVLQVGQGAEVPVEVGSGVVGPGLEHVGVGAIAALLHKLGHDLGGVEVVHLVLLVAGGVDGAEVARAALGRGALLDGHDLDAVLGQGAHGGHAGDAQAHDHDVGVHGLGDLADLGLGEELGHLGGRGILRRRRLGGTGGAGERGAGGGKAEHEAADLHGVAAGNGGLTHGLIPFRWRARTGPSLAPSRRS